MSSLRVIDPLSENMLAWHGNLYHRRDDCTLACVLSVSLLDNKFLVFFILGRFVGRWIDVVENI